MCLDHNGLKLETNLKEKTQNHSNIWRLNNMLLNNEWVNNEINKEIKKYLETKNEHNNQKPVGYSGSSPEREVHNNTGLPKEDRKISNKLHNPTSKRARGTTINKAQSEYKERNK